VLPKSAWAEEACDRRLFKALVFHRRKYETSGVVFARLEPKKTVADAG